MSSLDYREILLFYGLEDSDNAFSQYLRWGGLPFLYRIPLEDERTRTEYLGSIYDTIFVKDIVRRKNVRNVSLLDNLAVSANTVGEYMDALCETYMIDRVKLYDIKGKRVFEQQAKYYFEDLGLRNYLCRDKRFFDIEKVLEGAVYLKLKRSGYDVYVGRLNGKEIDFVGLRVDEVLYVQVALQVSGDETYEREFGNLKLIKDNYPKIVVTMDPNVGLIHDSGIVACSARQFLLNSKL